MALALLSNVYCKFGWYERMRRSFIPRFNIFVQTLLAFLIAILLVAVFHPKLQMSHRFDQLTSHLHEGASRLTRHIGDPTVAKPTMPRFQEAQNFQRRKVVIASSTGRPFQIYSYDCPWNHLHLSRGERKLWRKNMEVLTSACNHGTSYVNFSGLL